MTKTWKPVGEITETDMMAFRRVAADFNPAAPNWLLIRDELVRLGYGGSVQGSTVGQAAANIICGRAREMGAEARTSSMTITPFPASTARRKPTSGNPAALPKWATAGDIARSTGADVARVRVELARGGLPDAAERECQRKDSAERIEYDTTCWDVARLISKLPGPVGM